MSSMERLILSGRVGSFISRSQVTWMAWEVAVLLVKFMLYGFMLQISESAVALSM